MRTEYYFKILKGRVESVDRGADGRIILKLIIEIWGWFVDYSYLTQDKPSGCLL